MEENSNTENNLYDDPPPIFKNWNQMYIIVLLIHALTIFAFYVFTKIYS
jgi:hypothetical protein